MPALLIRIIPVAFILLLTGISLPQPVTTHLDDAKKEKVIQSVSRLLSDNYVYPEVAERMGNALRKHWDEGDYEAITGPVLFADRLTGDLFSIAHDKHLRVRYDGQTNEERQAGSRGSRGSRLERARKDNFGFHNVKVLEGNIGYLDLRGFHDARYAEEAAYEAMGKLIDTDVLLIDLRQNGGGSPTMIQLLTSYFYDDEPVHLNTFYWRPQDSYSETWTLEDLPGKRRPDWKIYVITSSYTFSAAEEFSYNLKHLKRAILVGETTGGGAHPGGLMRAAYDFSVWVPKGRAINPVTGTNWEGKGVSPHIEVPAETAHFVAYRKALEEMRASSHVEDHSHYDVLLKKLTDNPVSLFGE